MFSKLVLNFQTSKKRCRDRKAPAQVTKMGGVIKVLSEGELSERNLGLGCKAHGYLR